MAATFHEAIGFEEFQRMVTSLHANGDPVFVFFAGSNQDNGKSWCPDCEAAYPVVQSAVQSKAPNHSHFLHVQVGDKETWADKDCIFRRSPLVKLTHLPTLQRWGTPFILREGECRKGSLVELLLTEEP